MKRTGVTPAMTRALRVMPRTTRIRLAALTGLTLLAVLVLPGAASAYCPYPPFNAEYLERLAYQECQRAERNEHEQKEKERSETFQREIAENRRKTEEASPPSSPPEEPTESGSGGKSRSTTQLFVHVKGCTATADWRVNHSNYAVAGNVAVKIERYDRGHGRWKVTDSDTRPEKDYPWYWEQWAGTYRMRARFLGDSNLYASGSAATTVFRLQHGCRHEPPAP